MNDDWKLKALCRGQPAYLWDLDALSVGNKRTTQVDAEKICSGCPVKRECAEDALRHNDVGVIRAGVCLFSSARSNARHRLQKVAGIEVPEPKSMRRGAAPSPQVVDDWRNTQCDKCFANMRPQRFNAATWPIAGARAAYRKDRCIQCLRDEKRQSMSSARAAEAREAWAERRCVQCDVQLRPRDGLESDWPGTKQASGQGLCRPCYNHKRSGMPVGVRWADRKCVSCDVKLRPQRSTDTEYPGAVRVAAHGMCQPCYVRTRTGTAPSDRVRKSGAPWSERSCTVCSVKLRPYRCDPEQWPGTKKHAGNGVCRTCYMRQKRSKA